MKQFTIEEANLVCFYSDSKSTRSQVIDDILTSIPEVYETEMRELMYNVIEKLTSITNDEFSQIAIYPSDDEEQEG